MFYFSVNNNSFSITRNRRNFRFYWIINPTKRFLYMKFGKPFILHHVYDHQYKLDDAVENVTEMPDRHKLFPKLLFFGINSNIEW